MIDALRRWHDHWSFWVPYAIAGVALMVLGAWGLLTMLVLLEMLIFGGPGVLDLFGRRARTVTVTILRREELL